MPARISSPEKLPLKTFPFGDFFADAALGDEKVKTFVSNEPDDGGAAAAVCYKCGKGSAILVRPRLELVVHFLNLSHL